MSGFDLSELSYPFFTLLFIIALSSIRPYQIEWRRVIYYCWILGYICLLFCCYTLISGTFFKEYAFSHYGEDGNYIDRAYFWGYKVGIVPHLLCVHDREYRIDSTAKIIHVESMHWRKYLSNPIDSKMTK